MDDAADAAATEAGELAGDAEAAADAAATEVEQELNATDTDALITEDDTTPEAALTPEGFDFEQVQQMIEDSDLGDLQKTALTTGLNTVRDNPAQLEAVLTQIRDALGM